MAAAQGRGRSSLWIRIGEINRGCLHMCDPARSLSAGGMREREAGVTWDAGARVGRTAVSMKPASISNHQLCLNSSFGYFRSFHAAFAFRESPIPL